MGIGVSLFGKDQDQLTVAKSTYTTKPRFLNKVNALIVNTSTLVKEKDKIDKMIEQDENIDIDKIKKYFENVINEKHFLNNYSKSLARGT